MGRKKLTMSEKIRRYLVAHPHAKPREVAAALEVKPSLVYAVKYKSGVDPKWALNETVTAVQNVQERIKEFAFNEKPLAQPTAKPVDMVNNPPHYTAGGIETIDFLAAKLTREEFIGYLKGNVLKYGSRLGKKGDADTDAGKMAWYALKLREVLSLSA